MSRLTSTNSIATITNSNITNVENLYIQPAPPRNLPNNQPTPIQTHHLPGDICHTIKHSNQNKGTGVYADSIDIFTTLIKKNDDQINNDVHSLFDLVFQGQISERA